MRWNLYCRWWSPDRTESYWRLVCVCFDRESVGVVERALIAAGQEVKVGEVP